MVMKKFFLRSISIILVLSFFVLTIGASASTFASDYIFSAYAIVTSEGDGKITIGYSIRATRQMSELGATKIVIKDSSDNTVTTIRYTDPGYEYMMKSNTGSCTKTVPYNGAKGTTYYAIVFFRAKDSTGYDTATYTTSSVKA